MKNRLITINYVAILMLIGVFISSCATVNPLASPDEKRGKVLEMRDATLQSLYKVKPQVKNLVESAPGYAVFSDANVNVIFASFSGGYGVVNDNKSKKVTYMKMGEAGVGLGLGLKDFRSVFVFHDKATMDRFINDGWQFGAHADAAAILNQRGESVGGEIVADNITIYQLTKSGLALQATVKGTRYWKDNALNQ